MIVADVTTLVALSLMRKADLLTKLLGKVTATDSVMRELKAVLAALDPECPVPGADVVEVTSVDMSGGVLSVAESETLAAAQETKAKLVLSDDAVVRSEARAGHMGAMGTLGVLYAAKMRGLLADVDEPLARLRECGYAVSQRCEKALRERVKG